MEKQKNKLYKAICNESQYTANGEIIIGYFTGNDKEYFKGTTFLWWNDDWESSFITFSKDEFYEAVCEYKELKIDE